jgi:hypothetical protein
MPVNSKWIDFHEVPVEARMKTKAWAVTSKSQDSILGEIRWYGPWRQYVFYPKRETLFSCGCLKDIAQFIWEEMARRQGKPL